MITIDNIKSLLRKTDICRVIQVLGNNEKKIQILEAKTS